MENQVECINQMMRWLDNFYDIETKKTVITFINRIIEEEAYPKSSNEYIFLQVLYIYLQKGIPTSTIDQKDNISMMKRHVYGLNSIFMTLFIFVIGGGNDF